MSPEEQRQDPLSRWLTGRPALAGLLILTMIAIGVFFRFLRMD